MTRLATQFPFAVANREPGSLATAPHQYSMNLVLDPTTMAQLKPVYLVVELGANGSSKALAVLDGFRAEGGELSTGGMNPGCGGSFLTQLVMRCSAGTPAPQAFAKISATTQAVSFNVTLATQCSKDDWLTFWLVDEEGGYFPTTAAGHPGLIGCVSWTTEGGFFPTGYAGNGLIDGRTDFGFRGTIIHR
jgi:hypothetical protein